jgi:ABC-type branched-subunit amino acid transport system substrate-binding protein
MFRISPDNHRMVQGPSEYVESKKLFKTAAIVAEDSDFGGEGAATFVPLAQQVRMTIVSTGYALPSTDFTSMLNSVAVRKPDASPSSCWAATRSTSSARACIWA